MGIGVNLPNLVAEAASQYFVANKGLFKGDKGDAGIDAIPLTVSQITNNNDGTITILFSNGFSHTTAVLKGEQGVKGDDGNGITALDLIGDTGYGGSKSWILRYDNDVEEVLTLLNGDAINAVVPIDVSDLPKYENIYEVQMATGTKFRFSVFNGGVNLDKTEVKSLYEQNPDTNAFTDAEKAKLALTETHVELNGRDIANRNRANHTGTQSLDTVTETAVKKIMTDVERAKLANVPADTNTAINNIMTLLASNDVNLDTLQEIVNFIKLHEVELNSLTLDNIAETATKKIMTLDERNKLAGIEAGATGDQTAAEIKALYESTLNKVLTSVDSIGFTGGGTVSWNAEEHTIDVTNTYVTIQVGQEVGTLARNNTASSLTNGTVVMKTGALGASGRLTMASYDGVADGSRILGVVTQDTPAGADGFATYFGKIRGLNTSAWNQGDDLWVYGSNLTNIKPTEGLIMNIGFVVNSHATQGTIWVRRQAHTFIREV